jgi:cell division protein ZapE
VRGVYLWGGVGRGKSFLMDGFFAFVPDVTKKRSISTASCRRSTRHAATRARSRRWRWSRATSPRSTQILCLDEFHVTDITDAMLMRRLLEGLMEEGVVLLTTSNFEPRELYRHGLQRVMFLPAIDLILERMAVVNVDTGTDYRCASWRRPAPTTSDPRPTAPGRRLRHTSPATPATMRRSTSRTG